MLCHAKRLLLICKNLAKSTRLSTLATYQKMLKTKVRQGKKVTTAAKEASEVYKKMYGATPTTRWKRALREAKSDARDRVPIVGCGTMAPTKRRSRKR